MASKGRLESVALAHENPHFRRERQLEEIVTRMLLQMRERSQTSVDRLRFHNAFWFVLFRLGMEGVDMHEFLIFRDIITGRFQKLDEIMSELVGLLLYTTNGTRRDGDYFIHDLTKGSKMQLLEPSYFEEHELRGVETAIKFGIHAYILRLDPEKVLERAGLKAPID